MPRNPLDGIKTKRGRVVYDREKKPMTDEDRARIGFGKSPSAKKPTFFIKYLVETDAQLLTDKEIEIIVEWMSENPIWEVFAGGEFGGGGATRSID